MSASRIPAQINSETAIINLSALPRGIRRNPKLFDAALDREIRFSNSTQAASGDRFSSTNVPKCPTLTGTQPIY
jgi:hypothetical protein